MHRLSGYPSATALANMAQSVQLADGPSQGLSIGYNPGQHGAGFLLSADRYIVGYDPD